ncbi:MAG: N5-carboxyaminoimidazole ribonucleotide mutase [Candidatus Omnitrophica bacterium ADurb.Bin314]|jgi:phosphoribosylaminoimidazole carboxylase PurE protein|nr:MAG: N5-carboxyaminoimidazole ribonucleotide mutase [Candidatus Omnitrophica bacterium ADurb.Bin314]HOE68665.1 5-(carboxyamino)imidazole ribonucleotide mutase [Candidatus Omnitrophota bacterium]
MTKEIVSIVMGSDSDLDVMQECASVLKEFGIPFSMQVMSAHRTPELVAEFAASAAANGIKVIIAGAGGAAHLAGAVAANTVLPVIGVPLAATDLNGMDALLATVQMPAGIPVATVAVGKPGARNAALLAAQILGLSDAGVAGKLGAYKKKMAEACREKNQKLQNKLKET